MKMIVRFDKRYKRAALGDEICVVRPWMMWRRRRMPNQSREYLGFRLVLEVR